MTSVRPSAPSVNGSATTPISISTTAGMETTVPTTVVVMSGTTASTVEFMSSLVTVALPAMVIISTNMPNSIGSHASFAMACLVLCP